ncbi:MAG: hypothetical protein ACR2GR_05640 [Rhodothermales bacterium]
MEEREKRIVQFEDLNAVGKAVFLAGAAARVTSGLIDFTLKRAADIAADAEHAFKQGLDANVEDAKIIEERDLGKGERGNGGKGEKG